MAGKVALHEVIRRGADGHSIGRCQPLEACCHIRHFAQRQPFAAPSPADLAHHHQAGVDAYPDGQADTMPLLQARVERPIASIPASPVWIARWASSSCACG